ncbi:hypothetical protein BDW74DRAFT_178842 [Aspergillus multicolor]|uniref:ribonuclease HI n=1 Tax=Aspergillus multicolor TaxID=41759 RepID=UPI003CCCDC5D
MKLKMDACCSGATLNGFQGAAGALFTTKYETIGYYHIVRRRSGSDAWPTSNRAYLASIIVALEKGIERWMELKTRPELAVTIYSNSKYAVDCMGKRKKHWTVDEYDGRVYKANGDPVANQDLLEQAYELERSIKRWGAVEYVWIPKEKNKLDNKACHRALKSGIEGEEK